MGAAGLRATMSELVVPQECFQSIFVNLAGSEEGGGDVWEAGGSIKLCQLALCLFVTLHVQAFSDAWTMRPQTKPPMVKIPC